MARPREFDRQRAVQQAMELFWRQGYGATSVQELGQHMALNPGSLYNAFTDKHTLFLEALQCYQDREYVSACTIFAGPESGLSAIERFFQSVIDHDSTDPDHKGCFMVNSAAELADHDAQVRTLVGASRTMMITLFRDAIVQGQMARQINANRDPDQLAVFLTNTLFGLRLTAKVQPDRATLEAIVAASIHALS